MSCTSSGSLGIGLFILVHDAGGQWVDLAISLIYFFLKRIKALFAATGHGAQHGLHGIRVVADAHEFTQA